MLSSERFKKIIEMVNSKGSIRLNDIVNTLNISESTARRDITELNRKGLLQKIHGGATSLENKYLASESSLNERYLKNKDKKQLIAKFAARLIKDSDTIYLDAGSTTKFILDFLDAKNITVVTNGIQNAIELNNRGIRTILIGGEIRPISEATEGPFAINILSKLNFDKAFMGSNGFDEKSGFTTPSPNEAEVKRQAIKQAKKSYILADSSKENLVTLSNFANFDEVTLITDKISQKFSHINYLIAKEL